MNKHLASPTGADSFSSHENHDLYDRWSHWVSKVKHPVTWEIADLESKIKDSAYIQLYKKGYIRTLCWITDGSCWVYNEVDCFTGLTENGEA